jgi:hypothetical protein
MEQIWGYVSLIEYFVDEDEEGDWGTHWIWKGSKNKRTNSDAGLYSGTTARRFIYEKETKRQLGSNERLIRICKVRWCVNPYHQAINIVGRDR